MCQSYKILRRISLFLIIFTLLMTLKVQAQWGYQIGQKKVPKVLIHKDSLAFKVYTGHPRLFFRDTDLPELRKRIKGDFKNEWLENDP